MGLPMRCRLDFEYQANILSIMNTNIRRIGLFNMIAFAGVMATALPGNAALTVLSGWDLLATQTGTSFMGVPFVGVPLGTYDFEGTIGVQSVGNADTIMHRLSSSTVAVPGVAAPIPIELVQLQLVSAVPFPVEPGFAFYYITLQSNRTNTDIYPVGPHSTGAMTITFGPEPAPGEAHGTFNSFFDVYFDIRVGALDGLIVDSGVLQMSSTGTEWGHDAPAGAAIIDYVNFELNGTDGTNDFWPIGIIDEMHPSGAVHKVTFSSIPETATIMPLACVCLLGLSLRRRWSP